MFIERVWIKDFKGIDCSVEPGTATVFFGPNDSGKSNLLEAIDALLTWQGTWRRDPLTLVEKEPSPVRSSALIRGDDEVLERHLFLEPGGPTLMSERHLHLPPPLPTLTIQRESIATVTEVLRHHLLTHVADLCDDWPEVSEAYGDLLDEWLASRWFMFGLEETFWMYPPRDDVSERGNGAARRLARNRSLWKSRVPLLEPFIDALLAETADDTEPPEPEEAAPWLFEAGPDLPPPFFDVVQLSSDTPDIGALSERVARGIVDRLRLGTDVHWHTWRAGGGLHSMDPLWFEHGEGDWLRVSSQVRDACAELGRVASDISPEFVRRRYEIGIEALSPELWSANGGQRIRFLLHPVDGSFPEGFDVRVAASGIVVWTMVAISEALRRTATRRGETSPWGEVLILDEPERHLHPHAQREAASWLSDQVIAPTQVFIATHSLPFLDLDREDVQYLHAIREEGRTRVERVTDDVLGSLSKNAERSGVSVAELLELTRAVLVVEGTHDELMVNAFYGRELASNRIEILKLFGAKEAVSLAEMTFLDRHAVPLVVLFDNVSQDFLSGKRRAKTGEEKWIVGLQKAVREIRSIEDRLTFVPFEEPDILCALPDEVLLRTLKRHWPMGALFPGWEEVKRAWDEAGSPPDFKRFFAEAVGLQLPRKNPWTVFDVLLTQALAVREAEFPGIAARPSLNRAVNEVLAAVR